MEVAAGRKIPEINSGLSNILKKDTIKEYLPHLCETFSFTTSATLAYMMYGKFVSYASNKLLNERRIKRQSCEILLKR